MTQSNWQPKTYTEQLRETVEGFGPKKYIAKVSVSLLQSVDAQLRAASKLADACRNSADESVQAALAAFDRAKGG